MLFKNIFTKTIYEKRWTIVFWSIGVVAMSLIMIAFYHSFTDFADALKNLPKSFQNLIGDVASLKTVPGYVAQQVFALRIPLLTLIMGIILFTGLIAGDEAEGTLQTLLAQPVSRVRVYLEKLFAGVVISLIICLSAIVGVLIGLLLINEQMSFLRLTQAVIGVWLLTLVFGIFGFALGAITGKRGLAGSVTGLLAFGSYLITSFTPNVASLKTIDKFSPFHYYNNPAIAQYGLTGRNILVMLAIIIVLVVIAGVVFHKRDVYQP